MFQIVTIENYRGIQKLRLENLGRVNLFVGENNCGKTSILESFFLLTGLANPNLPIMTNMLRSKRMSGCEKLKYIFHNLDSQSFPHFHAIMSDGQERDLQISLGRDAIVAMDESSSESSNASSHDSPNMIKSLDLSFHVEAKDGASKHGRCGLDFQDDGRTFIRKDSSYKENMTGIFLSANGSSDNIPIQLSELIKRYQKQRLIEYARLFDSKITNVELLPDGLYIGYEGVAEMLPLDLSGEGFKKYLNVIGAVAAGINQLVLIDELENGIHFSAYGKLWNGLIELSRQYDVQVMVTTHSRELLEELVRTMGGRDDADDLVCVYTVAKTAKRGLQAYRYTKDGLIGAIAGNMEIRH